MNKKVHLIFLITFAIHLSVFSQDETVNYDESKVPNYTLPDALVMMNGTEVKDKETWVSKRRREIIDLFEKNVYGKSPGKLDSAFFKIISIDKNALDGKATRKEISINFSKKQKDIKIDLLIYLPNNSSNIHPVFLGMNFYGNQSVINDLEIPISTLWMRENEDFGIVNNKATEATRGVRHSRWPIEKILKRGYGVATFYYGDIDPDFDDGFQNGIHPLFYKHGQIKPENDEWGSIAAWSWGLSRAMDYLEADNDIDKSQVAVMGHSRLGKAALWAGAIDERFAIVISNDSGCGGAALSRRRVGETVDIINKHFPHWFCSNFKKYNNNEDKLPVDQHMLIALIAPRPVYIASAAEDLWADPKGELLSAKNASSVYKLFGKTGLDDFEMPEINKPIIKTIGYHIRSGKHDVTLYDWEKFMDFADTQYRSSN